VLDATLHGFKERFLRGIVRVHITHKYIIHPEYSVVNPEVLRSSP
jgi:hypothetical protein